jgi:UDP-N-acetylglucosamine 2-epimerase
MKVVSVVGARPQFVKLASLSRRLRTGHEEVIVHTGQHYSASMSLSFFEDLDIPLPDIDLGIGSASHGAQTAAMLSALEEVLVAERPDAVIVFGDTNSTLAGALAAAKLRMPSVHVESGLRSFNRSMPEEVNRVVADHICDILFAPTATAMNNLQREGLADRAHLTGDITVDVLEENVQRSKAVSRVLQTLHLAPREYILLTLHRPYNVDDPNYLGLILKRVGALGRTVVFPAHPRTAAVIERNQLRIPRGVRLLPPQGYLGFLELQANARQVVTDSGGVQKEAYLLAVPCITVRPETEWIETLEGGWNVLADPADEQFVTKIRASQPAGERRPIFGANVANRMVSLLETLIRTPG